METKEAERAVIAKPVASRPTFSTFRSFSELLAGAINDSTPKIGSESGVAPIKPKTVRFKPALNRTSAAIFSSQVTPRLIFLFKPFSIFSHLIFSVLDKFSLRSLEQQSAIQWIPFRIRTVSGL